VKTFFNENKKVYEDQYKRLAARSETQSPGHGVFFITYPMSTKTEILRSFPPKGTTDVLIARFFDVYNQDPPFQIIHGPTYQKQYDQHWRSPQDSDIVWLGLTYAMMMVSLVSYGKNADEPAEYRGRTEQMYKDYKRLTAQSLMLTDFNKGSPYLLEMYIFYILADLGRSKDAEINILVGTATLVRHAMRLGYHRDSKYFPGLSAFQGEMRRRVWALVKHADLRISAQFGLPPMVRNELANTEMMRNLFDDELDENVAELPESRPLSEATPISYLIYKTHMVDIAYEIVEETQKIGLPSYERAMELDRKIRKLHEEVPLQFKFRPYEESIRDPSDIIMKRYILEIMYLKFLLLIHRKFCNCTRYPYSARTGLESAMQILKHQQTLHHESRQGRRLSDAKMFVTALTAHDYILAAMIVCMALYRSVEDERAGRSPFDPYDRSNRPNMMAAIEGSLRIWDSQKEDSMEAFKATGILTAMTQSLRNYQDVSKPAQPRQPTTSPFGTSPFSPSVSDDIKLAPEHSAAMTLNMLSSGAMGSGAAGINLFGTAPASFDAAPSAPGQTTTTATTTTAAFGAVDGVSGPASPFSSLFGSSTVFQPLDVQSNLDWVC
jgi:Fungal specific transcription factor domain